MHLGDHLVLLVHEFVVELVDVDGVNFRPSVGLDVVKVVNTSRVGVPMGGVVDGALSEVDGLVDSEVWAVEGVEDTVGEGGS